MDIIFGNSRIRKRCTKNPSEKLRRRLDDMSAAANMAVLVTLPGRCHALSADKKGQWAVDLEGPNRLVFEPTGDPPPVEVEGRLDLGAVTAVRLIEVTDYHG